MASNDDSVWALPQLQCPGCQSMLDLSGVKITKLSKEQRRQLHRSYTQGSTQDSVYRGPSDSEMEPDDSPEHTFVVVSCGNHFCRQYNRLKVVRIPKLSTPGIKVSLE